jgi:hypothetical protein
MQPPTPAFTPAIPTRFPHDPLDAGSSGPGAAFAPVRPARLSGDAPPHLMVIIDTEEEFDWSGEFSRRATAVTSMAHQGPVQRLLNRHGVVPTYAVDYPVASQRDGFEPLRDWVKDGRCEIGAHLHPWVNPPFDEKVTPRNSCPGNLPAELEAAKLQVLTDQIETTLGVRARVYRAGRYGVGPNSASLLTRFGYLVWHSPSLVPGHTPYVRTQRDVSVFLDWLRRYLDFFFGELHGKASTPLQVREELLRGDPPGRDA